MTYKKEIIKRLIGIGGKTQTRSIGNNLWRENGCYCT